MTKPRVHVVKIDLDIDLDEEIKKATAVSDEIKVHIKGFLEEKQMRRQEISKRVKPTPKEWLPKMDRLFDALQKAGDGALNKDEMAQTIDVPPNEIGPIIQRFKSYLKAEKNNDWHLEIKVRSKIRTYRLRKLI